MSKISSPVDRLKSKVSILEEIGANKCNFQLIKVIYRMPFKAEPPSKVLRSCNNRSALNDKEFVIKELENLLQKGCVAKASYDSKILIPLSVAQNKKKR